MSAISKVVILGGSAGGLQAMFAILRQLTPSFRHPLILILHRATGADSTLADLLVGKTHLTVCEIEEKEPVREGHLYLCPSDYHVLLESDETFSLDASEKVNFSRPSLDVVFRSAAIVFRERLVAALLSGANSDGAEGLLYVKKMGGTTIVQDPADAQVGFMPQAAMAITKPDKVMTSVEIGEYLNGLG